MVKIKVNNYSPFLFNRQIRLIFPVLVDIISITLKNRKEAKNFMNNDVLTILMEIERKIDNIQNTMVTKEHCTERQVNCKVAISAKKSIALYSAVTAFIVGILALVSKVF